MRNFCTLIFLSFFIFAQHKLCAQKIQFNTVIKNVLGGPFDIKTDKFGILWIANVGKGLQRYDGIKLKSYTVDPNNSNSIGSNLAVCLHIDRENIIWVGTAGKGLQRFDPETSTFSKFTHNSSDPASISSDSISAITEDHLGNLWVGTYAGVELLDRKTGKFTHYASIAGDNTSLINNKVRCIFEDKKGQLWVGCANRPFWMSVDPQQFASGALHRFDRNTGKFMRFYVEGGDIKNENNGITKIYEDSRGRFWIATEQPALYLMDRNSGSFTRYHFDLRDKGPLRKAKKNDRLVRIISLISEDKTGALWIGMSGSGLIRFDENNLRSEHFGFIYDEKAMVSAQDTITGYDSFMPYAVTSTNDNVFWVCSNNGRLHNINFNKTKIPFYSLNEKDGAFAFYREPKTNILWFGSAKGLIRKDLITKKEKRWLNNPKNKKSLANNVINSILSDEEGNLWLGTFDGLDKFNPKTEIFTHFKNDPKNPNSLLLNTLNLLIFDHQKNIWVTSGLGVSMLDRKNGTFINYKIDDGEKAANRNYNVTGIGEDKQHHFWLATSSGVFKLDPSSGKFTRYINENAINFILVDSKGTVWAGGADALFYYDIEKDKFTVFADEHSEVPINGVMNILEDNFKNLWISTKNSIVKISPERQIVKNFNKKDGVYTCGFEYNDNYKDSDGKLYLGIDNGFYSFFPQEISDISHTPVLNIVNFKINDKNISSEPEGILSTPIWETSEIKLSHDQNTFSFDFFAANYIDPENQKYLYMLENYDHNWHDLGLDHSATFYNIPAGKYNFRAKVFNVDGRSSEKNIQISVSPPWWKTWWAYLLYTIALISGGYLLFKYQQNYIVRKERERIQQKELEQAKEIEKAYLDLKSTQAQLVQSEKMASLGELTAGIAHEIQNPLNFVNNFSELSVELAKELQEEIKKPEKNWTLIDELAEDLSQNQQKINHHGKRASSIVKSMLEHTRSSTGVRALTDINALADEYLRLSYHGLRAKEKSFNAGMEANLQADLPKVEIVTQDIGRVLLNIITNAFFAVNEKNNKGETSYQPMVSLRTTFNSQNKTVNIAISDNGEGIPDRIKDKIFQPFFTTKPTGQGTGLGLSLAYDIIKAHGGQLNVESKEGEGTKFTIVLPVS
ncbi:MAG: two-component regulator propeller domain-containing protein [Saprospiraceae bacterium]